MLPFSLGEAEHDCAACLASGCQPTVARNFVWEK